MIIPPTKQWPEILQHPDKVVLYNTIRRAQYGVDGILPVEFLPTYLRLRKDSARRCLVTEINGDVVVSIVKQVRMFGNNFARLEGLPISLNSKEENEQRVLDLLIGSGHIGKIRCCKTEASQLTLRDIKFSEEAAYSNFYSFSTRRAQHIERSVWRSPHGVNLANRLGGVTFDLATIEDAPAFRQLYDGWVNKKLNDDHYVMYKPLYLSICERLRTKGFVLGVDCFILKFDGVPVGVTAYLMIDNCAHLLMNISIQLTDLPTPERYQGLVKKIGYLLHYFVIKHMAKQEIDYVLLGYCEKGDQLGKYKEATSEGKTQLVVSDFINKQTPKNPAKKGFGV